MKWDGVIAIASELHPETVGGGAPMGHTLLLTAV